MSGHAPSPQLFRFLSVTAIAVAALFMGPGARAQDFSLSAPITLGGTNTLAGGVNLSGSVVGISEASGVAPQYAFISTNGVATNLGTLGGVVSVATAVNNSGVVVGYSATSPSNTNHAFVYANGVMTDLGTLGGSTSDARSINSSGTIVGVAENGSGLSHPYAYSGGVMTDLYNGTGPGPYFSTASSINDTGTIAGQCLVTGFGNHASTLNNGAVTDLGTLGGDNSAALAINNAGAVVGYADIPDDVAHHAFAYRNRVMTDLGTLGGASSQANAINSVGVIVGTSDFPSTASGHGFIVVNGTMTDLNSVVSLPSDTIFSAVGVNDHNQVVVNTALGYTYLLTPLATHLQVSAPTAATVGVSTVVAMTALDAFGNLAGGYAGTTTLTTTDGAAVLPATVTFSGGTASAAVTFGTAGAQTVTATDTVTSSISGTSASTAVTVPGPAITQQPASQTVNVGANATFTVAANANSSPTFQWSFDGTPIAGATGASYTVSDAQPGEAGSYAVTLTNASGSSTSAAALLTVAAATGGPSISVEPQPVTVNTGGTVVLTVGLSTGTTTGSVTPRAAAAYTYQWFFDGTALADGDGVSGSQTPDLLLSGPSVRAGSYACLVSNGSGTEFSKPATLTVVSSSDPGRVINLSCRADVGTADNVLITGFAIGGPGTPGDMPILVRSSGPALAAFISSRTLPDPALNLYNLSLPAGLLATNTGWAGASAISMAASEVGAFPWTSATSHDAALFKTVPAGIYTANTSGENGDTGVALSEIYDATPAASLTSASPQLLNVSARAQVGASSNVLIAGFVIGGTTARTVLIRASGPALAQFSVSGTLPDPLLQLYATASPNLVLASNTGWGGSPGITTAATSVGAFSWGTAATADSAILITLPPGAYTANVSGASGDTGVALIEVYALP